MPATPDTPRSTPPDSDERLLEEAVRLGILSEDQAADCRHVREAMRGMGIVPKSLGEIAREKGYLREEDLERIRLRPPEPKAADGAAVEVAGYRIHGLLERGERDATYQALREGTGQRCALSVLREEAGPEEVASFCEEARRLTRCSHPNLVSGIDAGLEAPPLFVAVEMAAGEILDRVIGEKGPLPEDRAIGVTRDLARALEAVHSSGLVHGEVHPRRVLLPRSGPARLMAIRPLTGASPSAETISPERVLEDGIPGPPSDLYSLGATLFMLLAGRPPFIALTPKEVMAKHLVEPASSVRVYAPGASEEADRIVRRLLEKKPADRYPSASALLADLDRISPAAEPAAPVAGTEATAPAVAPKARALPLATRAPAPSPWTVPAIAMGVAAVFLIVAVVAIWGRSPPAGPTSAPRRSTRRQPPPRRPPPRPEVPTPGETAEVEPRPRAGVVHREPDVPDAEVEAVPTGEGPAEETAVPAVEKVEPRPHPGVERRAFIDELLSCLAGYRFEDATEACVRRIDEGRIPDLARGARDGLAAVEDVLRRAREGIGRWEGEKRTVRLRDGLEIEGTVTRDPDGLLSLRSSEGEVAVPMRLLSADDLIALANVDDPLGVGLVHLLLYRDAERAEEAFRSLPDEVIGPYREVLDTLVFESLFERAETAYGRGEWRRSLEAYLDLLEAFPDPEAFAADPDRILEKVRNGIVLSRIAGAYRTGIEIVHGSLSFPYRLHDPQAWEDWSAEGEEGEEGEITGPASWKGRLTGDLVVECSIERGGGDLWVEIHSDPEGGKAYRISAAETGWLLDKRSGKGAREVLARSESGGGGTSRLISVRIERIGEEVRVHLDGRPVPVLQAADGDLHEGTVRTGGDLSRLETIRITGRLPRDRRR